MPRHLQLPLTSVAESEKIWRPEISQCTFSIYIIYIYIILWLMMLIGERSDTRTMATCEQHHQTVRTISSEAERTSWMMKEGYRGTRRGTCRMYDTQDRPVWPILYARPIKARLHGMNVRSVAMLRPRWVAVSANSNRLVNATSFLLLSTLHASKTVLITFLNN